MSVKNSTLSLTKLKARLDDEVNARNRLDELDVSRPDPLMVAQQTRDEYSALICALFAYGSAHQIVKFLNRLDFTLLDADESQIESAFEGYYYRFQNSEDIKALFIALNRLKRQGSLEAHFYRAYSDTSDVMQGVFALIDLIRDSNPYDSKGYHFLVGSSHKGSSYKRWLMYLRWMVRKDHLDMGLWSRVDTKDLLLPLDTHTFNVSRKLGLLKRKSCDLKAVREVTKALRRFDPKDPVKYDFALYRLGQEAIIS